MRRLSAFAAFAALLMAPRLVSAQSQPRTPQIVAKDSGAAMERLADGVYAIIHDDATEEWPHGNTGVIVGRDGVLVIDTNYLPARAVDDIALIRKITPLPVRYLINTHWHGDHTHGNGVYRDAFPGLTILGPRESAGFIELNLLKLPMGAVAPNSYNRRTLAQLEKVLTNGRDSAGRAITEATRKSLTVNVAQRRAEIAELAKVKVAPPNLVFERAMNLDLGDRRVDIRNMGVANSPADVIVYLPKERVLFTGDIVVYPLPYTILASPVPWIDVLKDLETYPVTALVPGHGPVMANHDYTKRVHLLFDTIRSQVDSMYRRGMNIFEVPKAVNVNSLRAQFTVPSGRPVSQEYWDSVISNVASQMAECLHGYRC